MKFFYPLLFIALIALIGWGIAVAIYLFTTRKR